MKFIANRWFAVLGFVLIGTGCASTTYFKVKDVQSSKVYYTEALENLKGGAVQLKDGHTGSVVTLQNSEVKEITSQEYKDGLAALKSPVVPAATSTPPTTTSTPAVESPAAHTEPAVTPTPVSGDKK